MRDNGFDGNQQLPPGPPFNPQFNPYQQQFDDENQFGQ
jgi:hypothetical protein